MERITNKKLQNTIDTINWATNSGERSIWFKDSDGNLKSRIGMYKLDTNVGGYQLTKIVNDGGGETDLTHRLSAKEMFYFLQGYLLRMEQSALSRTKLNEARKVV